MIPFILSEVEASFYRVNEKATFYKVAVRKGLGVGWNQFRIFFSGVPAKAKD